MKLFNSIALLLGSWVLVYNASAFDHNYSQWNALLQKYVTSTNGGVTTSVQYSELVTNTVQLNEVLQSLSKVTQSEFDSWSQQQQIAFLVNAYNAFTWKLIVDHHPVTSIKKIGGWRNQWKMDFFELLGKPRNLDWIEHSVLRKKYKEPRIHFALNCASISCPPLRQQAYTAQNLEEQFQNQTILFLRNPQETKIDVQNKTIKVSKLFDWFAKDFGENTQEVIAWISQYLPTTVSIKDFELQYTNYDWNLNGK
jgi:hypothetical protein